MSTHSIEKSPAAFLKHADRMLSAALQNGNALVATQGAADLLLHSYRLSCTGAVAAGSGPGRNQLRRSASALREMEAADGLGGLS